VVLLNLHNGVFDKEVTLRLLSTFKKKKQSKFVSSLVFVKAIYDTSSLNTKRR
jgi:hypothetical protein